MDDVFEFASVSFRPRRTIVVRLRNDLFQPLLIEVARFENGSWLNSESHSFDTGKQAELYIEQLIRQFENEGIFLSEQSAATRPEKVIATSPNPEIDRLSSLLEVLHAWATKMGEEPETIAAIAQLQTILRRCSADAFARADRQMDLFESDFREVEHIYQLMRKVGGEILSALVPYQYPKPAVLDQLFLRHTGATGFGVVRLVDKRREVLRWSIFAAGGQDRIMQCLARRFAQSGIRTVGQLLALSEHDAYAIVRCNPLLWVLFVRRITSLGCDFGLSGETRRSVGAIRNRVWQRATAGG